MLLKVWGLGVYGLGITVKGSVLDLRSVFWKGGLFSSVRKPSLPQEGPQTVLNLGLQKFVGLSSDDICPTTGGEFSR